MYATPILVYFELTEKCNLKCNHCYNKYDLGTGIKDANDPGILNILDKIFDAGVFDIALTGGEPLIRANLIQEILDRGKKRNIDISVNTNLLLLQDEMIPVMQSAKWLLVSCPSSNPDVYREMTGGGNYLQFEEKVKSLIRHNIGHTINMVVNKNNIADIRSTALRMEELGVEIFSVSPMYYCIQDEELKKDILTRDELHILIRDLVWISENTRLKVDMSDAIPKCSIPEDILQLNLPFMLRSCQAGRRSVVVTSSGDVKPCPNIEQVYGNVRDLPLKEIYDKMSEWRDGSQLPEGCKSCEAENYCHGACRSQSEKFFNKDKRLDPWAKGPFQSYPYTPSSFSGKVKTRQIRSSDPVYINPNVRHRKENGYYLFYDNENSVTIKVNEPVLQFVNDLKNKIANGNSDFTIGEIAEIYQVQSDDQSFIKIINELFSIGILRTHADK